MGTSSLAGQMMTFTTMEFRGDVFLKVFMLHIIGPSFIRLILSEYMRKKEWIKPCDMLLQFGGD